MPLSFCIHSFCKVRGPFFEYLKSNWIIKLVAELYKKDRNACRGHEKYLHKVFRNMKKDPKPAQSLSFFIMHELARVSMEHALALV